MTHAIVFLVGVVLIGLSGSWLVAMVMTDGIHRIDLDGFIVAGLIVTGFILIKITTLRLDGCNPDHIVHEATSGQVAAPGDQKDRREPFSCPIEFEHWCAEKFRERGWQASVTPGSGDHGVDVFAARGDMSVVVQCKLHSKPVGNKAVMEAIAGKAFKKAEICVVVATSGFTPKAIELAKATQTHLVDAQGLASFISRITQS